MKKLFAFLLIVPVLIMGCDKPGKNGRTEEDDLNGEEFAKAAPRVKDGDVVLANSELSEKFLTEVTYPDKDLSFTKIYDYYGGFRENGELTWSNWNKNWPDGDKPSSYSIRWKKLDDITISYTLHLEDALGWSQDLDIKANSSYVDITNLVPNDTYTFSVKANDDNKTVMASGTFSTTGSVHQVFFKSKCRNARDLGGWKTTDGKTIRYRRIYRGGRMNDPWETMLSRTGEKEVVAEGIGAELELRGSDDYMTVPAVKGLDHCHPCIEEGGKVMLGVTKPSAKNCAKWLVFDDSSPWSAEKKAPYLKDDGIINKDKLGEITPTAEEYAAFQAAYKAKTKECFEFVLNSVKAGKGVYFHCSLGRDRTGTMSILLMGILGVREGDISKEYELTYFAPVGFSVSSSDEGSNPEPVFNNTRMHWVYSDIVPYFWSLSTDGTFANGVENYLLNIGVTKAQINEFRSTMLVD
ncbi:MAG: tyrosine-protein phosphatase [Bacteroidales bacterium]|nr:tyrosine-protein phosphatase [Bacteroidales bacterium]